MAIAFRESPPAGVAQLSAAHSRRAAASGGSPRPGQVFYTVPSDHYNCPVGSYTHNIPLPKEREPELMNTLSLMVNVGYLKMDEVPGIPRLAATPAVTIYAPLGHHAGRAGCRARVGHAGAPDAAARSGDARWRRRRSVAAAWPSDVHGDSRGALLGRRLEPWLRRQSHLHRSSPTMSSIR